MVSFYYLCNEDYAYIIIGSSNISKTAFRSNFELDILHKVKLGVVKINYFQIGLMDLFHSVIR